MHRFYLPKRKTNKFEDFFDFFDATFENTLCRNIVFLVSLKIDNDFIPLFVQNNTILINIYHTKYLNANSHVTHNQKSKVRKI